MLIQILLLLLLQQQQLLMGMVSLDSHLKGKGLKCYNVAKVDHATTPTTQLPASAWPAPNEAVDSTLDDPPEKKDKFLVLKGMHFVGGRVGGWVAWR